MFIVNGKTFDESLATKLGSGSEGTVLTFSDDPGLCVKLFHPPEKGDSGAAQLAAYRSKKVGHITSSNVRLGRQFVIPQTLATDGRGKTIGYLMNRVTAGFEKLKVLTDRPERTKYGLNLGFIAQLFASIFEDLALIHRAGLVVGDVNLGCVLFDPRGPDRAWCDTDSWSYPGGYPCLATTELFCHPDLYPNLDKSVKQIVEAKPEHDAFAFSVIFSQVAVMGAHPFKQGQHPTLSSLHERTKAAATVYDQDVKWPPLLRARPEILSDDVLHMLVSALKRKRTGLDPALLRTMGSEMATCSSCHIEYHRSRKHCPQCQTQTMVIWTAPVLLLIQELFATTGDILRVQAIGHQLRIASRKGSAVEIISVSNIGKIAFHGNLTFIPGAEYRFFDESLVVCPDPASLAPVSLEIYSLAGGLTKKPGTTTGVLEGGKAVWDTSPQSLYRTAGNSLMRGAYEDGLFLEETLMQVFQGQTWFTCDRHISGREVIFGYDRALRDWEWFVVSRETTGKHSHHKITTLKPLRSGEKQTDFSVYFRTDAVLLVRKTSYRGQECIRYAIIGLDGTVKADVMLSGSDAGFPHWENLRGKLFQQASILHSTLQGIVKQDLAQGSYTLLADTTGHISENDALLSFDNKVAAVTSGKILTIGRK